jgi:SepF-like predicted cell division protein (DUF552 family)
VSPFGLFRKKKDEPQPEQQPQEEKPATQEQPIAEEQPAAEPQPVVEQKPAIETPPPASEKAETEPQTYLKAMPLRELADLENVENEVKNGNIIILRITPLASKSIEDVKQAVDQLYAFAESINGDIARLGEERVVICPKTVRIWREKTPAQNVPLPTAA